MLLIVVKPQPSLISQIYLLVCLLGSFFFLHMDQAGLHGVGNFRLYYSCEDIWSRQNLYCFSITLELSIDSCFFIVS